MATYNEFSEYLDCPECGRLGLEDVYVGGDGFWEDKIHCQQCCQEFWTAPYKTVIVPMLAAKYGATEEQVRAAEKRRREAWADAVSEP